MVPNVASSNLVTRPIKSKNGPKGPFFNLTKTTDQMRTESSTTSKRAKRSAGDLLGVPRSVGIADRVNPSGRARIKIKHGFMPCFVFIVVRNNGSNPVRQQVDLINAVQSNRYA